MKNDVIGIIGTPKHEIKTVIKNKDGLKLNKTSNANPQKGNLIL